PAFSPGGLSERGFLEVFPPPDVTIAVAPVCLPQSLFLANGQQVLGWTDLRHAHHRSKRTVGNLLHRISARKRLVMINLRRCSENRALWNATASHPRWRRAPGGAVSPQWRRRRLLP